MTTEEDVSKLTLRKFDNNTIDGKKGIGRIQERGEGFFLAF